MSIFRKLLYLFFYLYHVKRELPVVTERNRWMVYLKGTGFSSVKFETEHNIIHPF